MKDEMDRALKPLIFTEEKKRETMRMAESAEMAAQAGMTKAVEMTGSVEPQHRRGRRVLRKMAAAAACLALLSGAAVFAAGPEAITAQLRALLIPVNESAVYDGIELTVLSAAADEDSTVILFSLRDLTENRIDEALLLDEYRVHGASVTGAVPLSYDQDTKTLTMMINGSGSKLQTSRVSIEVTSLLPGGGRRFEQFTGIDVASLLENQKQRGELPVLSRNEDSYSVWNIQCTGENNIAAAYQERFNETDEIPVLESGGLDLPVAGASWMRLDNIAYADGWLHIRVNLDSELGKYNHGYFYLTDETGQDLNAAVLNKPYVSQQHEEFIIEVDEADLEQYQLWGSFTSAENPIKGAWNISFDLKTPEVLHWQGSLDLGASPWGPSVLNSVKISSLGISFEGENLVLEPESVSLIALDGTALAADYSAFTSVEDGQSFIKLTACWPELDLSQVKSLEVNGMEVPLR